MKVIGALVASVAVSAVEAGTLAVTWDDCGAQHATVTDVQPTSIPTGATAVITGTGTVDEEVTSAHFAATIKAAGVKLASCEGDATTDIACKLPLGAGTITVKAVSYPIAAGSVSIPVEVTTSSLIPASLAKVDAEIRATEQNGEDVICLNVHTAKQVEASGVDCSTAACPDQCECSLSKCGSEIDTCLADATCAQGQACALACPCSDTACSLKCAAENPSTKALPVANCINSNCASVSAVQAGTLAVTWDDCGAQHATVTDVQPTSIPTGTTAVITGTGTVNEDVTSAHFAATIKAAGVKLASCEGDATTDIACKLPLGAGTITVKAVSYPIVAGSVSIPVEVTTSALIPASLAKVDAEIRATEQNGEDVICLNVHTAKQVEASGVDCSTAACPDQCECSLSKCGSEIDTCLADATCAQGQACALACPCSDTACSLKCAAENPSTKALPVANCINSNCAAVVV